MLGIEARSRTYMGLSLFLAAGHLFDLSLGIGLNHHIGWFNSITELYSRWDPTYIAQPFYMEITSLLSGIVMIPMTLLMAYGFRKQARWLITLVPLYTGFIVCNNICWYWNEYFCPIPPHSWAWLIFWSSPWWILPVYLCWKVCREPGANPAESTP